MLGGGLGNNPHENWPDPWSDVAPTRCRLTDRAATGAARAHEAAQVEAAAVERQPREQKAYIFGVLAFRPRAGNGLQGATPSGRRERDRSRLGARAGAAHHAALEHEGKTPRALAS
jgi:hypothetical protein